MLYYLYKQRKELILMATTNKALNDALRNQYLELLIEFFEARDEEVLRTASNEICIPVVDSEGNEKFIQLPIKVPTGTRGSNEEFDGYAAAEDYKMKCEAKAMKAAEKAKKAEKDKAKREAKKAEKKGE
jgi:hypothetical protein